MRGTPRATMHAGFFHLSSKRRRKRPARRSRSRKTSRHENSHEFCYWSIVFALLPSNVSKQRGRAVVRVLSDSPDNRVRCTLKARRPCSSQSCGTAASVSELPSSMSVWRLDIRTRCGRQAPVRSLSERSSIVTRGSDGRRASCASVNFVCARITVSSVGSLLRVVSKSASSSRCGASIQKASSD